ncbi:putative membrane-bound dehydrogenase domain-containing protein [Cyclobacterium xiamenense]|uniref:Putative membrane-bound dehydrogenase domain-containing protein n=1 Tax=Cyclobacterium xiamenense TaxID=1297121 RepID=A0A1H7B820_9BACT|nr:PVC-type heme-binding CxxCH protein [Cyclobacterium xiamenense]SEJ73024.1 putative membrane-bound dehydrogenase domain-containing protein [Cyclobacterium xiamenense]
MIRSTIPLLTLLLAFGACEDSKYAGPLSPDASMATFAIHEDFEVQLFAAEPHIKDPVDLVFDEYGVAYAVEMPDYPYKPEPGKGQGVIKKLMDTDGDGRIDASTVFAEGIADATSLMPWKGGLLVTAAPHIYYMKDLDGDGKADQKESIFSGFFENNSEAQITNLRLGIDNWIYAANNGQRSEVTYTENPDAEPLNLQGADFRFRLDTEKFEKESGTAQFGMTFDDWGNKFFTQNTLHVQQAAIPRRYLERHGHLSSMSVNHNISDHDFEMFQMTPPPYWRAERTERRNKQYQEQQLDRVEHAADYFTGASGGTVYNGGAFPEGFYGNLFTGDVAGNLVHRDLLVADAQAPTQIARRAGEESDREFIASTDPWFRPAGFTVGPDGYLYLVDFYRQHIETPVSIPDDLKEEMDFMNGADKGRIYRILPKSAAATPANSIDFSSMDAKTLVAQLAHQNGWWRSTAQRLILEEPKQEYIPYLEELAAGEQPQSRVLALYLLQTMNALEQHMVESALKSDHPGLVKNALILAEDYPELQGAIAAKTTDPSQMVALQAILSLGNQEDAFVRENLAASLVEKGQNKWFRTAILSSNAGSGPEILAILDKEHGFFATSESWKKDYINEVAHILGAKGEEESIKSYMDLLASLPDTVQDEWQGEALAGLQKGLEKSASRHSDTLSSLKTQLESASNTSDLPLKDLVALL